MRIAFPCVLFASLVLAGCHTPYRVTTKNGSAALMNGTEDVLFEANADAPVTVRYDMKGKSGSWRLEVLRPDGAVADEVPPSGPPSGVLEFPGAAGQWICRLHFTGYGGDYSVKIEQGG